MIPPSSLSTAPSRLTAVHRRLLRRRISRTTFSTPLDGLRGAARRRPPSLVPTTTAPHRPLPTYATGRLFSSGAGRGPCGSSPTSLAAKTATGACLFLVSISDPVISSFEALSKDENDSYWMHRRQLSQEQESREDERCNEEGGSGSRLRNTHKHHSLDDKAGADTIERDLPAYSRIVVVGGGMAGLHTALALAERMDDPSSQVASPPYEKSQRQANQIIVLEGSRISNGSSGRAKGLVIPGFQVPLENLLEGASDADNPGWTVPSLVHSLSNTLGLGDPKKEGYTKDVAEQLYSMSYEAMDRLRDIVKRYEIDCDWVESGAVEGSIHPIDEEDDDEEEDDGCQILTSEQVNRIMGRPKEAKELYMWGEYDPSCAGVDPLALTVGLADAAERWGVKIYEHTKVTKLEKRTSTSREGVGEELSQGKYTIVTDGGNEIRCDHVVLCTGAESISDKVSRRLSGSFVPVYTWMAATEPLMERCPLKPGVVNTVLSGSSNTKDEVKPCPAPMCGDDHVSLNYWRNDNTSERRLLFGSLADTYSLPKWLVSRRLSGALAEVYPQLSDARFERVWGGKLAFALNSMPLIGRDADYDDDISNADDDGTDYLAQGGVWYATGFAGHGIVPTALAGSLMADAILGTPNKQQWALFQEYFPPALWNGYPFSRAGAGAVLCVYNAWDWMGKRGVPLPALPKLW